MRKFRIYGTGRIFKYNNSEFPWKLERGRLFCNLTTRKS